MDSHKHGGYLGAYILLLIVHDLVTFSNTIVNPLLPIFAKQIGASGSYIGFVVASYSISRIILEIPSGFISLRYGYFIPLSIGLVFIAFGNVLSSFSIYPFHLVIARMLIGLGSSLFFTISLSFLVKLFDESRRGKALGVFKSIQFVASIIGSAVSGYVISIINFRATFLISGIIVFVALFLMVVPSTIRNHPNDEYSEYAFSLSSMKAIFKNTNLLILCFATFVLFIMSSGIESTIFPIYANEKLGFSFTQIGLFMGFRSLGFVVSVMTMGALSDRIGRRPVLLIGLVSSAILVLMLNFVEAFYSVAGIFLGLGISVGAFWVVAPIIAAEAVSSSFRGIAIGTYKTFFDLGSIVGPILMSTLMDVSGFSICFYFASALIFANLVLTLRIKV
jgi:MFS family permease